MDTEFHLMSSGDRLAVTGDPKAVDEFLLSEGLREGVQDHGPRLKAVLGAAAVGTQAGAEIAAKSIRWRLLTEESARRIKSMGLRRAADTGLETGVLLGRKGGQIGAFVEFTERSRSLLNPAVLAGVAGILAEVARQQTMAEITAYLGRIEVGVSDVIRRLDDAAVSQVIAAGTEIELAMAIRDRNGGVVSPASWDRVKHTPTMVGAAHESMLRRLTAIAGGISRRTKVKDLATVAEKAERDVLECLAILAHCFYLRDAVDALTLDRVQQQGSPQEFAAHLDTLTEHRRVRLDQLTHGAESLLAAMGRAARTANAKVLLHGTRHPAAAVGSFNTIAAIVDDFRQQFDIESHSRPWQARRWNDAVRDTARSVTELARDVQPDQVARIAETALPVVLAIAAKSRPGTKS